MFRGGSIIRLIDVCFIILIGFIAITDRQVKTRLELPTQAPADAPVELLQVLEIGIITDSSQALTYYRPSAANSDLLEPFTLPGWFYSMAWEEAGEMQNDAALDSLELKQKLYDLHNRFRIEQINLRPDDDSPVEGTVAVYDVCRSLHLTDPAIDLQAGELQ